VYSLASVQQLGVKSSLALDGQLGQMEKAIPGEFPKYEALSYVWGSTLRTHSITLNTERMTITKSLDKVLRHIRLQTQPRTLWIDQLCIYVS
jgi:hypothetical protein